MAQRHPRDTPSSNSHGTAVLRRHAQQSPWHSAARATCATRPTPIVIARYCVPRHSAERGIRRVASMLEGMALRHQDWCIGRSGCRSAMEIAAGRRVDGAVLGDCWVLSVAPCLGDCGSRHGVAVSLELVRRTCSGWRRVVGIASVLSRLLFHWDW